MAGVDRAPLLGELDGGDAFDLDASESADRRRDTVIVVRRHRKYRLLVKVGHAIVGGLPPK